MVLNELHCENLSNPLGIDNLKPKFSWYFNSKKRGIKQNAYKIIVSDSKTEIQNNLGNIWDSGKVNSSDNINIKYEGSPLKSCKIYYWKVIVWDSNDNSQGYSAANTFETAFLNQSDWSGDWIEGKGSGELFRTEFEVNKKIIKARAYISGLGFNQLYINGIKIGDTALDPGYTDYDKKIFYSVHDVSKELKEGTNAVGVILGNSFFSRSKDDISLRKIARGYRQNPILLLNLIITFNDGSKLNVTSNKNWKFNKGPIIYNDLYNGEIYDARFEKKGWNLSRYNDSDWESVKIAEFYKDRFVSQSTFPTIKKRKKLKPKKIIILENGKNIYDFGQNFSGWIQIKARGSKGDKLVVKFAELLNSDNTLNLLPNRTAKSEDTYIFGSEKVIIYEPSFTYHGFRYAELEKTGEAVVEEVNGWFVNSSVERTGKFICSNQLINRIHNNIIWGQLSNLMSIPTDCPQRDERMGWLADAHLTAEESIYNFNMLNFYKKYLDDIKKSQKKDGSIPDVVPPFWDLYPGAPEWGAACVLLPWYAYVYYGDKDLLAENFVMMSRWFGQLNKFVEDGILKFEKYGDWCSPTQTVSLDTPLFFISTWYYYYTSMILSKISNILDKNQEAETFLKKSIEIKDSINKVFVKGDLLSNGAWDYLISQIKNNNLLDSKTIEAEIDLLKGTGGVKSQTPCILMLFMDLLPENKKINILNQLLDSVVKYNGYHLKTGIIGTKYILDVLTMYGYGEIAFKILTQKTYPGWGYMLKEGATTLWEKWEFLDNDCMNSHNHIMYGSIDAWFYTTLAGINPDENNPGFKKIIIKPILLGDLNYVKSEVRSIKGTIKSEWHKRGEHFELKVAIPPNSLAEIYLPGALFKNYIVKENGMVIYKDKKFIAGNQCINNAELFENFIKISTDSGNYDFILEKL